MRRNGYARCGERATTRHSCPSGAREAESRALRAPRSDIDLAERDRTDRRRAFAQLLGDLAGLRKSILFGAR